MIEDCACGSGVQVWHAGMVNLYGCSLAAGVTVGPFVEIQRGACVGADSKVCSHTFICGGAQIGARVFIGHGVMFCNDAYPMIGGVLRLQPVVVEDDVSIGSGAVILPGVRIGIGAMIGAGAVVVGEVRPLTVVVGNPAHEVRRFRDLQEREDFIARQCDHLHAST